MSFEPIVVFGTVCLDRFYRVASLPTPGGYVEVAAELESLGGEAANTAAALARWNAPVALVGNPVGCDADGERVLALLAGADLESVQARRDVCTPVCDVLVTPDGERTMIGRGFSAMSDAEPPDIELPSRGWFTADPNLGKLAEQAICAAKQSRLSVYLMDFVGRQREDLVRGCTLWQSSTDWAGVRGDEEANLRFCSDHSTRFDFTTLLTDGPRALYLCEPGSEPARYPAYACERPVDVTGAGDVFRAGVLYGLAQGQRLLPAVGFGAAAGCLNCRKMGATGGLGSIQEVLDLQRKQPEVSAAYA